MDQDERRLEEAQYEENRLQTIGSKLLKELSDAERRRIDTVTKIRTKAEQEIALFEKKSLQEIAELKKELQRNDNLTKSNHMTKLNLERELTNKRLAKDAEKRAEAERAKKEELVESRKKKIKE
jgi:hypothetical protein